jgi:predicted permease
MLSDLFFRLRSLFRRSVVEGELDEELRFHLEHQIEKHIQSGLTREESTRRTRLEFGGISQVKGECREARGVSFLETLVQDLRFGFRTLRRSPGFTIVAILTLALGIGLNSCIFTIFDAAAFQPLRVKDPSTIVDVYQSIQGEPGSYRSFSYPEYVALRNLNGVFSGMIAYAWTPVELSVKNGGQDSEAEETQGLLVSGNYFSVLGGEAAQGRMFSSDEDWNSNSEPVIVLSHSLWVRRFGSDPGVVGKTVRINGHQFTVLGVARQDFVGTEPQVPDFWAPLTTQPQMTPANDQLHDRGSFWLQVIARLKPGVSPTGAQASMDVLINRLAGDYLGTTQISKIILAPGTLIARPDERSQINSLAFVVLGAVGLILLIACANVVNLLLARAAGRQKELGIRLSLGATRRRLFRQLLTESCLIAVISGGIGLVSARWLPGVLLHQLQPRYEEPFALPLNLDLPVLGYTLVAMFVTMAICGLAPALRFSKVDPLPAMNQSSNILGQRMTRSRLQNLFVSAEICVSLVLLLSAGLLVRALQRALTVDPGFDMNHILVVSLDLDQHGYDEARAEEFHSQLEQRLQAVPGVKSMSVVSIAPLGGVSRAANITIADGNGRVGPPNELFDYWVVSPNYFQTMGIPILQGQGFDLQASAGGPPTAIINEALARQVWPGESAVGKLLRLGPPTVPFTRIVGVVKDTRGARLWEEDKPYVYLPIIQGRDGPPIQTEQLGMKLLVRTEISPAIVAPTVSRIVKALDPGIQANCTFMAKSRDRWLWFSEVGATLASSFGFLALVLAGVGIYGVMSYSISQQMREMGIRIALGATRLDILTVVMSQGLRVSLFGVGIGLVLSLAVVQVFSKILYGVSVTDPATFVTIPLFLTGVAFLGCYVPARRAMRVNPSITLRYE